MGQNLILTTYLTSKPDPQAGAKRRTRYLKWLKTRYRSWRGGAAPEQPGIPGPDDFDRIRVWYESIIRVGCRGVIFHDELSPAFVRRWSHPQVRFEPYAPRTPRSLNDERYLCYLDWLKAHPEVERVFLVDLFDVEFFRDPFELMDDQQWDIYCGGDPGEHNDRRNRQKMVQAFGEPLYENEIKLNAGTCGGPRESIVRLLETIVSTLEELTASGKVANLNMAVFNKCVYDLFPKDRILYGRPLNSRFKRYENTGDFAIRHK